MGQESSRDDDSGVFGDDISFGIDGKINVGETVTAGGDNASNLKDHDNNRDDDSGLLGDDFSFGVDGEINAGGTVNTDGDTALTYEDHSFLYLSLGKRKLEL